MRIAIDPAGIRCPEDYARICYRFLNIRYINNKRIRIINSGLTTEISSSMLRINMKEKMFSRIYTDMSIPTEEEFVREFLKSKTCICTGSFDHIGNCQLSFIARNTYPESVPYPIMINDTSGMFTDLAIKLAKELEQV